LNFYKETALKNILSVSVQGKKIKSQKQIKIKENLTL
jgi:hypothetical protein